MIFALCICIEKHRGGGGKEQSAYTTRVHVQGRPKRRWIVRVCLLDGHILCPIINLNFCWGQKLAMVYL